MTKCYNCNSTKVAPVYQNIVQCRDCGVIWEVGAYRFSGNQEASPINWRRIMDTLLWALAIILGLALLVLALAIHLGLAVVSIPVIILV